MLLSLGERVEAFWRVLEVGFLCGKPGRVVFVLLWILFLSLKLSHLSFPHAISYFCFNAMWAKDCVPFSLNSYITFLFFPNLFFFGDILAVRNCIWSIVLSSCEVLIWIWGSYFLEQRAKPNMFFMSSYLGLCCHTRHLSSALFCRVHEHINYYKCKINLPP